MRLAVYLDQAFWTDGKDVYAARSFVKFLGQLATEFDELTVTARLSPTPSASHYRLPPPARFAPLPHYKNAAAAPEVLTAVRGTARSFEALLDEVDAVWLLGPHPFALYLCHLAERRRKRVILGVRQDLPRYTRTRHPRRPDLALAASALEAAFRRKSRRHPVVVVGPDLAEQYAGAVAVLEIYVSLVTGAEILPAKAVDARDYSGPMNVLSVGRLDPEKNPLLLVEVMGRLEDRWRMTICGDGPLEQDLRTAITTRRLTERIDPRGHVPFGEELLQAYRNAHFLLHTSWSEGFPQVLLEGFAAALPTVATDVGGIAAAAGGAVALIPPGDPEAAVRALRSLAEDQAERRRLVTAGHDFIAAQTLESESRRVAEFIKAT